MEREDKRLAMSVADLSKTLGIGLTNAYRLVSKDKSFYPAKKICGRYIVSVELLNKWLNEQNK